MPPLTMHAIIAKEVADRLQNRFLEEERGSLYLGSTAPDIRIITRWERERTHFFDLGRFDEQDSVAGLFAAYPDLARPAALNRSTVAFVTGYLTHLAMDETWIITVYRPFFGEGSPLGGSLRARVMDRALQFSMDREKRCDRDLIAHVMEAVARCDLRLQVDFLEGGTIRRWRSVILDVLSQLPEWERFRYVAGRHLREAGINSPQAVEEFLRSLPDLVDETVRYLSPERIQAFLEDARNRSLEVVREYLQCA